MTTIAEQLSTALQRIDTATELSGRTPSSVRLLAVSKTKPASDIRQAYQAGQTDFGENYLQESLQKISDLQKLSITWHFIGPLQSNKSRTVAENFDWIHTIDRLKLAERLNQQRPSNLLPLNVCIQVNISGEASKSGVELGDVEALAEAISALPNLQLRGLMAIPAPSHDPIQQRHNFVPLHQLFNKIKMQYPNMDTLSIGMSTDLEAAIFEGSTLVRLGTAIFGARN